MGGDGSNPAVIVCSNLRVCSVMDNPYESGFNITFTDFKLRKERSAGASFKISGTKERTYAIIDRNENTNYETKNIVKILQIKPQSNVS